MTQRVLKLNLGQTLKLIKTGKMATADELLKQYMSQVDALQQLKLEMQGVLMASKGMFKLYPDSPHLKAKIECLETWISRIEQLEANG